MAAALADAGFEASLGPLFATPYEAAGWADSREPDIVGVSTLAGAHVTLVPALLGALRERGCGAPVVLAGIVPEAHHESLFTCVYSRYSDRTRRSIRSRYLYWESRIKWRRPYRIAARDDALFNLPGTALRG